MSKEADNKKAKLTLRIEIDGEEKTERVIDGADKIAYILGENGLLDDELMALLGY